MNEQNRYPFLSEKNLENIRHCSFPFIVQSNYDTGTGLAVMDCIVNSISILRSRHYVFKNFGIAIFKGLGIYSAGTGNAPDVPQVNVQGLQLGQGIEVVLNDWSNPVYTYNGVLNNPITTINSIDITGQRVTAFPNYNYLHLVNIAPPSNYSNLIAQKTIGTVVSERTAVAPQILCSIDSRNAPSEFYFRNSNYSQLLFSFTPVQTTTATAVIQGIIDFDLYQYSMKN